MDQYIQRYRKYIHQDLKNIDVDTASYKQHLHKSFEWFCCILLSVQDNSIWLRWEDVPIELREKKHMKRDMGIDAWNIRENRVCQMKLYNGTISWSSISTFLGACMGFFLESVKILYRNKESQLNPQLTAIIENKTIQDRTVLDSEFRKEIKLIQGLTFPEFSIKESHSLRKYQIDSIKVIKLGKNENKNVFVCIPTGCGKTFTILKYHKRFPKEVICVLVPTIVLLEQWERECINMEIKPYLIGTGHNHDLSVYQKESVILCVYNSFPNIYEEKDVINRFVIDEAHHLITPEIYMYNDNQESHSSEESDSDISEEEGSEYEEDSSLDSKEEKDEDIPKLSYRKCINSLFETKRVIAISATIDKPTDDSLFYEYSIRKAINEGYLCDYQFIFPIFESENTSNEKLAYYLVNKQRESHCIIYAPRCEEGRGFCSLLNSLEKGCAGYLDCETSFRERKRLFEGFRSGEIKFLVNVKILVEGFNAPHAKSIFFLHASSSELFVIQAIGRILRTHVDKILATVYIPFTHEKDLHKIQLFLSQLCEYDERVKLSIFEKRLGGYINIERCEDKEEYDNDGESKQDDSVFDHRYNLIADSLGNSNKLEEKSLEKAIWVKKFYLENGRLPKSTIKSKLTSYDVIYESFISRWFSLMKCVKKGSSIITSILYPSVEKIFIETLGHDWYIHNNFKISLKIAEQFKNFFIKNNRKPRRILEGKSIQEKNMCSPEQKLENKLANWYRSVKKTKDEKIRPHVNKMMCELIGKNWKKQTLEDNATERAEEFEKFFLENARIPKMVLKHKSQIQKINASDSEKVENKLANWFRLMKDAKFSKGHCVLYKPVEKILIELLGEDWYK
jgi:superfamily II DNA or RNA helicase